ncbi:hypothetical protein J6590_046858 [Homalodisca vitripennis]|nr:hypothetical protein J6590_046858 [Homalodisca vitripennis]
MAYNYCSSLVFEFWQIPLNVEYRELSKVVCKYACSRCVENHLGSRLYVQALAVLGALVTVYDIYRIIGTEAKAPRMQRDFQLMSLTLGVLVYSILLFGVWLHSPFMMFPWIVFQAAFLAHSVSKAVLERLDPSHTQLYLSILFLNNLVQVTCVFLRVLNETFK